MEYFVPIIQNIQSYHNHKNYEISNLGHVRRIGTTKNLRKYKKGFWSDPIHKKKIHFEDVEFNTLEFNNIKVMYVFNNYSARMLNGVGENYKEIRTIVYFGEVVPIDMSKINLRFGTKIYKQENMFFYTHKKQNHPKIPYGTIFKTTIKQVGKDS